MSDPGSVIIRLDPTHWQCLEDAASRYCRLLVSGWTVRPSTSGIDSPLYYTRRSAGRPHFKHRRSESQLCSRITRISQAAGGWLTFQIGRRPLLHHHLRARRRKTSLMGGGRSVSNTWLFELWVQGARLSHVSLARG